MKVFTNSEFTGHWPVGTAAVIIAKDKYDAARILSNELFDFGLEQQIGIDNMIEVDVTEEKAIILRDGDY